MTKFKTVCIFLTLIWFTLSIGACNPLAQPTPTLFPFPTAVISTSILPTSALPTATLSVPTSTLPTLPPQPASTATLPPARTATTPPQAQPTSNVKRISFAPGATNATVQGNIVANSVDRYVLRVSSGQTIAVAVNSPTALWLQVNGADGNVLKSMGAGSANWSGIAPATQDYFLTLSTQNQSAATYTLQVTVPPLGSTPVQDDPRRISFAPGAISASVQGSTATPGQDRFVIRALAGQTMTVNAISAQNNVILIIYGADGNVLISDHAGATSWTGVLPSTQDYLIDTRSFGSNVVNFTLQVTIPPK